MLHNTEQAPGTPLQVTWSAGGDGDKGNLPPCVPDGDGGPVIVEDEDVVPVPRVVEKEVEQPPTDTSSKQAVEEGEDAPAVLRARRSRKQPVEQD